MTLNVLLAGNPNGGKTTLFNILTAQHQRIGNWPGVTVEKKTGSFLIENRTIHLTDLPGVYSLAVNPNESQEGQVTMLALHEASFDLIINVIDACHLERHLYLTSQLLELGKPVIIALNMTDIAHQRGIEIDIQTLSSTLKCTVVELQAHRGIGIDDLKQALIHPKFDFQQGFKLSLSPALKKIIVETQASWPHLSLNAIYRLLESVDSGSKTPTYPGLTTSLRDFADKRQQTLEGNKSALHHEADILLADARYQAIHQVVQAVQRSAKDTQENWTARLDRIVLHRFWGLPLFFGIMYLLFFFAIQIGGVFQSFFDITSETIFVQGSAWLLQQCHAPPWLIGFCAHGVGKGINTMLSFVPVLAAMYFLLSLLEISGYMVRAAFVVDKIMRLLGLPGKAFIPMIVGFGCNVPAVMAARTLETQRDRWLTILMTPFMSCSARLAIYAVFVAAFFPEAGQNIVFMLYLIGILMAVGTGYLVRHTFLAGSTSPLILELPAYHRPSWRRLWKETQIRLRYFLIRAGKLIIPVCGLLSLLNSFTWHHGLMLAQSPQSTLLTWIGQWIVPLFSPMGIQADNWPAAVGLLTGLMAKEVVIGSLNSLYDQMGGASGFKTMQQAFDGPIGAFAYLLFIALYVPCISTIAAIRQETNRQFMGFSIGWSLFVAYGVAVIFYQAATFIRDSGQSLWMVSLGCALVGCMLLGFRSFLNHRVPHVNSVT